MLVVSFVQSNTPRDDHGSWTWHLYLAGRKENEKMKERLEHARNIFHHRREHSEFANIIQFYHIHRGGRLSGHLSACQVAFALSVGHRWNRLRIDAKFIFAWREKEILCVRERYSSCSLILALWVTLKWKNSHSHSTSGEEDSHASNQKFLRYKKAWIFAIFHLQLSWVSNSLLIRFNFPCIMIIEQNCCQNMTQQSQPPRPLTKNAPNN